jgi:hypothetical protein
MKVLQVQQRNAPCAGAPLPPALAAAAACNASCAALLVLVRICERVAALELEEEAADSLDGCGRSSTRNLPTDQQR